MAVVRRAVAHLPAVKGRPALWKRRRFARRTIPVDASPLKKTRRAAVEEKDAAALPCFDVGEGGAPKEVILLDSCSSPLRPLPAAAAELPCVDGYQILTKIGKGSYGVVFRARERATGDTVAVKKSKLDSAAIREVSILRSLPAHPCIVGLKEAIFDGRGRQVFMVMEYMESDLLGVIMEAPALNEGTAKFLMIQLLQGVSFLHANRVLHRDLKPSNLLLNLDGDLKVCDFGLSRHCIGGDIETQQPYTNRVGTRWYKAPELLLRGAEEGYYSSAIDMWSVGCVMGELLARTPFFPGKTELDQLDRILGVLGVPDEATCPEFASLCSKMNLVFTQYRGNTLKEKLPPSSLSEAGLDLLAGLLAFDPSRRLTAEEALNHPWFKEVPAPTRPRLQF